MTDRAKARLLAGGLSLLLSAEVVLILLGALVLIHRIRLGGPNDGFGSIPFAQPATGIITAGTGGLAPGAGGVTFVPPGGGGPTTQPPTTACPPDCPAEPIAGVTVSANLPVFGHLTLPLRLGTSSGNNRTFSVGPPRARLSVTLSRHPLQDIWPGQTSTAATSWLHDLLRRLSGGKSTGNGNGLARGHHSHGPPLIHGVGRTLHSLLD
jgi:hypothetical protein